MTDKSRHVLSLPEGSTNTACFHAQQAVEKSLKALLTSWGIAFPKTHDLTRLLDPKILLTYGSCSGNLWSLHA